jgi:cytochrome c5
MNVLKLPVNSILLLLTCTALLFLPFPLVYGQSATLDVDTLKLPAVKVGEAVFTVDLTLVPGSDPITSDLVLGSVPFTFDLTAAAEAPNADLTGASSFEGATLTVPALQIGESSFLLKLILSNAAPVQFQLTEFSKNSEASSGSALNFFESNVSPQIVDSRCVTCHVDGGIANNTSLVFQRSGGSSVATNFEVFDNFRNSRSDALDYILSKVSGSIAHGGGTQLAIGSTDYNNLQSFLSGLISGNGATVSSGSSTFFTGVENLSPAKTLRRAAIILAGRAPSAAEIAAVGNGDENELKATIRNLMVGDNFHDFLLEGANDRLLVRGTMDNTFLDGGGVFPNFANTWIELALADSAKGYGFGFDQSRFVDGVDRGLRNSPLELIAYVVENEKPYSEILTADYMMANSVAAFAMNATGSFPDPEDYSDFQPVTLDSYYAWNDDVVREEVVEVNQTRILNPGSLAYDYPHAGVLNTQAFLFRYPTTATNRNRARSRATFMHFLDTDIEASAPRTTDPVALADTNNPTLYNPNCTVCHATLDPMSGAFQNYAEEGNYRANGTDSLDNFYKYPEDGNTPYQHGDTWYRDMRAPGLLGENAPSNENSLQWIAQRISQDTRFARAAVKFWWPSMIGSGLLTQPEVQSDANYESKLMAFDAQTAAIQSLANNFAADGMNLKNLLVEMAMTPWFRAAGVNESSLDPIEAEAHSLANLGSERLLSPEQLARKTSSLTGFTWQNDYDFNRDRRRSGLGNNYQLYYGGIDAAGITKRATDMTALMSTVAMTHASESSCPIVLREFALNDGDRALFNGLDSSVTPLSEGVETFSVATTFDETYIQRSVSVSLNPASKNLFISINGNFCDYNEATDQCNSYNDLQIDRLDIQLPDGSVSSLEASAANTILPSDCAWYAGEDDIGLCGSNTLIFPYDVPIAGSYKITANIWPRIDGNDDPRSRNLSISVGAESTDAPKQSTANGALAIKQKLVDLHDKLFGESYTTDASEISLAYELFVESWDETRNLPNAIWDYSNISWGPDIACNVWQDYEIGVGLPTDIPPLTMQNNDWGSGPFPSVRLSDEMGNYLGEAGSDPNFTKRAWVTVMAYMLSHYDYLYE